MERRYFDSNLEIDGTAEELYVQARNGYLDRYDTLESVAEILYGEGLDEKGDAVMAFREELDDQPGDVPFGRMKADIYRGYTGFLAEDESFGNVAMIHVEYNDRNDSLTVVLESRYDEDGEPRGSSFQLTLPEFKSMSRRDFEKRCNAAWFYAQPIG